MSADPSTSSQSSAESSSLPSPPLFPSEPPAFPYFKGAKFLVRKHEPPRTLEMGYWRKRGRCGGPEVIGNPSQLELCLAHPPTPGITYSEEARCIEIAKIIRGGQSCGAQTVLTVDGLVAKFYDPLYYDFGGDHWEDSEIHVTGDADKHYITEVTAYSEMRGTSLEGSIMPAYHGSWTMDIPILFNGSRKNRKVRLILVEYIPGTSMHSLNPEDLTSQERDNIMIKVIEAKIDLLFMGLRHEDYEPRNIMLSLPEGSETYETGDLRICIIDYAISRFLKDSGRRAPVPEVYNPLFYWTGQRQWSSWGWLPPRQEAIDWMWKIWGNGGRDGKYLAVERDSESIFGNPKSVDVPH